MPKRKSTVITRAFIEGGFASVKENIRYLARTQAQGFSKVNDHLARHDVELEAIKEMVGTRKEMHNLVHELKNKGIRLDESKIFVS